MFITDRAKIFSSLVFYQQIDTKTYIQQSRNKNKIWRLQARDFNVHLRFSGLKATGAET